MNRFKFSLMYIPAFMIVLGGLANSAQCQGRVGVDTEVERSDWTQTDPALQTQLSLDMNGKPLRVVLDTIPRQTGVPFRAETNLQEYRVSLHTVAQPTTVVMQRLVDLFGHGDLPSKNYGWSRSRGAGKWHYVLTRNARAYEQEQAMLDLPRTRLVQWLKDTRAFLRLPAARRKFFRSDYRGLRYFIETGATFEAHPGAEAIAALSDEQMNTLLRQGQVEVPHLALSPASLAYLQRAVPHGSGVTRDFNDYNPPSQARLSLEDDGKQYAQWRGISSIKLEFGSGFPRYCPMSFAFDTLGQLPDEEAVPSDIKGSPQINLLAHEPASQGKWPHATLSAALRLLAREAGVNIYAEIFPKSARTLNRTTGTPEGLLKFICSTYGCDWRKVGGDYIVFSKAWAQDRAADIPQPLLDRWSGSYTQHKRYEVQELIQMACLKDEQQVTVIDILKVQLPFQPANCAALRLLGLVSPHDIARAYTSDGVLIDTLDDAHLRVAQQLFHRKSIALPLKVRLEYLKRVQYNYIKAGPVIDFTDSADASASQWISDYSQQPAPVK